VVWALLDAGASEVSVWNRTAERAVELATELGAVAVARPVAADVIVNCTAVGMAGEGVEALGLENLAPGAVVVDMVYGEKPTPIEKWALDGGARFVGGLEILVQQGARSLEIWTGRDAPVDVMRASVGDLMGLRPR
jgi:shikimate dehydrogenase